MIYEDPKHMSQWKDICTIRLKKDSKKSISYLSINAVKCLLCSLMFLVDYISSYF